MIKKEKVFELKIEEDDDLSGIDSISLVDDPAIEVNWIAFNKHKEDFFIPDGEDEKYLSLIMDKSEAEDDLLNDGWEVASVRVLGEESFYGTEPNQPSAQDTEEYRVRYKYILNPNISQSAIINSTRQFCRTILNQNRVWRIEDMDAVFNEFGQPATLWRGGYNCRHRWAEIKYKRDTTIINKASVKTGIESESVPPQPTTYTEKTINNPSPSTIRNLGLAKEKFAGGKISFDYDDTLSTSKGKEMAIKLIDAGYDVYVISARQDKEGMLAVAKELGIPDSRVYATGSNKAKVEKIKELGIKKHYDNNPDVIDEIKKNIPDVEAINFDYNVGTIGGYVDPGISKKKKPIEKGLVEPSMFDYLTPKQKMSKQYFQIDNEEKRIVLGPAMIPDLKIFRKDALGNPYYVFFTSDTIKMIAEKYMKNQYTRNNDLMHDGKAVTDIYVVESWIKEDDNDKSVKYGYGDLPIGTWFISMKIPKTPKGDEVWNQVKEGKLNGFSVSGFFEEVKAFTKEEAFLYQVAEILKKA